MGATYELPRKSDNLAFFGNENDGIINLSIKDDELNILRFNPKTLQLSGEKTIEIPNATRNLVSEIVINHGKNYYWVRSDFKKPGKKDLLYCQQIDVVKGNVIGEPTLILESEELVGSKVRKTGFRPKWKTDYKYSFNFSADRKLVLIKYRTDPDKRNPKKVYGNIGFHVFDDKMKKVWGNEFTMPYSDFFMDVIDFSIDAEANAYMLIKIFNSKDRKHDQKDGTAGYHYEILKFKDGSTEPEIFKLDPENRFLKDALIMEINGNEMLFACTYGNKYWYGEEGLFLSVLGRDGKITKFGKGFYEFPDEELKKHVSKSELKDMEKTNEYTNSPSKLHDLIVDKDGNIFISGEGAYTTLTPSGTSTNYYFTDIFTAKISAAGELDWFRRIPKKQVTFYPTGIGFKTVYDSSGYSILYIDNEANMHLKDDELPKQHLDGVGGILIAVKISNSGKITREILLNTRDEKLMVHPTQFDRINQNQFIGRTILKENNTYQLMLISSK